MPLDPLPTSLVAAYEAGIEGELANIALYQDELLPAVEAYPDITKVFTNLMSASQYKHLPTFESCLDETCRNEYAGTGQGRHNKVRGQSNGHSHGTKNGPSVGKYIKVHVQSTGGRKPGKGKNYHSNKDRNN